MYPALSQQEYIILNLVAEGPSYAYEMLTKLTNQGLAIPSATLYNKLRKLRCLRYVTATVKTSEAGPVRIVYTLTNTGRYRLHTFNSELTSRVEELHARYKTELQSLRKLMSSQ